nr:NAD(P)H-hydrate epimerase [Synergistaceae bacterium]
MALTKNYDEEIDSGGFFQREVVYYGVTSPETISREEMRDVDRRAVEDFGIPSILLMENAAIAVVRELWDYTRFAVVCSVGSNGGDGLAIARHLCVLGKDVRVFIIGDTEKAAADFTTNLTIMKHLAPDVINILDLDGEDGEKFDDFVSALKGCETCVDAIFGTGLNRPLEGLYKKVVEAINQNAFHVVSVDIPSGLDANTGDELGAAVKAHKTVTFHRMKKCMDIKPEYCGDITVAYIGVPG